MSFERRIKIFSAFPPNNAGKKYMEQEYYEWYKMISKNVYIEIDDMMLSSSEGILYMVVHYNTVAIEKEPNVEKPHGPRNVTFSNFNKPDKSVKIDLEN